jgi:hypothetical protein
MRMLLFALAIIALMPLPTAAAGIEFDDVIGRWCGDITEYTFSRTQLNVRWFKDNSKRTLMIDIEKPDDQTIAIYWLPKKPEGNLTWFSLSDDKRALIQEPQTKGDKGPRRKFRRC